MSSIATTLAAAQEAKGEYRAGGTDLMDRMRHHVSSGAVVDISRIPNLDHIAFGADGTCSIGAFVTVDQVAKSDLIRQGYPGLAQAADALANPQIRRAASMGGALLQRNRCWYYRHEEISCFKKGGTTCPMRAGNHQYGVCFDLGPCVSPHPSTLGMVLLAYDAEIAIHGKANRKIADLYGDGKDATKDHLLATDEILTHIHLPKPIAVESAVYFRSISRARAEWPLVEVLVIARSGDSLNNVRVVIGGVANVPLRLPKVEAYLKGRSAQAAVYAEAGRLAAEDANPLPDTQYKVELVERSVAEAVERAFSILESDD
jgi:xanthine dehydrogenase YagS FAD-binding subunit